MKNILVIVFGILIQTVEARATAGCALSLESPESMATDRSDDASHINDSLNNFISYLTALLEQGFLAPAQISRWLEQDLSTESLITVLEARSRSSLSIHRDQIQNALEGNLNHDRLRKWASQILEKKAQIDKRRFQVSVETNNPIVHRQQEFYPVLPGRLKIRRNQASDNSDFELTHTILAGSTVVTQAQWVNVLKSLPPIDLQPGEEAIQTLWTADGPVQFNPDHPVTGVTFWSALVFANRLSESNSLSPAYDLSKIQFNGTIEKGDLWPKENQPARKEPLPFNSPSGSYYDTEGFRLPTEAEWEFIASAGGGNPYLQKPGLEDRVWFKENSDNRIHAVGEKLPIVVNNKPFYDLYGNVSEWVFAADTFAYPRGKDPIYFIWPVSSGAMIARGGDYHVERSGNFGRFFPPSSVPNFGTGFRLVRTIK